MLLVYINNLIAGHVSLPHQTMEAQQELLLSSRLEPSPRNCSLRTFASPAVRRLISAKTLWNMKLDRTELLAVIINERMTKYPKGFTANEEKVKVLFSLPTTAFGLLFSLSEAERIEKRFSLILLRLGGGKKEKNRKKRCDYREAGKMRNYNSKRLIKLRWLRYLVSFRWETLSCFPNDNLNWLL